MPTTTTHGQWGSFLEENPKRHDVIHHQRGIIGRPRTSCLVVGDNGVFTKRNRRRKTRRPHSLIFVNCRNQCVDVACGGIHLASGKHQRVVANCKSVWKMLQARPPGTLRLTLIEQIHAYKIQSHIAGAVCAFESRRLYQALDYQLL